jgi:ATP-dependent exoDNAse (exonuclease V) beta subunit
MPQANAMADAERAARLARDAAHRARALDTSTSFLVQAPAGSGKTELLIQRYLALLARVESPHRVVAMTFTRKAASEMRERVVAALAGARDGTPVRSEHQRTTRELAAAALAQADRKGWSLLAHPAQLAIVTIDALCGMLARQAPVTSSLGVSPRIVERAEALYAEAAQATLLDAGPGDVSWQRLLAHLDNNGQQVVGLIASMLAKREQWLPHVAGRDEADLRGHVELTLCAEIDAELASAKARFDPGVLAMLARCAGRAAEVLQADGGDPELARALLRCFEHGGTPPPSHEHVFAWRALGDWLLTSRDEVRKTMNVSAGVRPLKFDRTQKGEVEDMLAALAGREELVKALVHARELPDPEYADRDWEIVSALLHVLPLAAAQLRLTFARRAAVDFAELNAAATSALGAAEAPSDLLLRLDLAIEHLLVDEFQDTSEAQFRLLGLLTSGWQPDDGRTLFAVGDPMQSIYRFRDAEVRLFLTAMETGRIGDVPVEFIDLARNFRSQGTLVAWANRVFPGILGERNEPGRGAVAFATAAAEHPDDPHGTPTIEVVAAREEEAARVVARVRDALAEGARDVAILVRARSDLEAILPALRRAEIAFAAVELDALDARQAVRDVAALAHAMLQPEDRLAALSVLRSPCCGLVLADLFVAAAHLRQGLPGLFAALPTVDGLTDDGRERIERLAQVMLPAFAEHGRGRFARRVRGAWLALGGPATLDESIDFGAVEDFFGLLESHAFGGDVDDWQAVRDELGERFVTSAEEAITPVKIMTVFRAKGLEFDTVIMPGLARTLPADDRELMKWRNRSRGLLLASLGNKRNASPLHGYLNWLASTEADHELGRLLYVGVTRARRRLHLLAVGQASVDENTGAAAWRTPRSASALGKLWKMLSGGVEPPVVTPGEAVRPADEGPALARHSRAFALPQLPATVPPSALRAPSAFSPTFEWARADSAIIGTIAHRYLAKRAQDAAALHDATARATLAPRIRAELAAEGLAGRTLEDATAAVLETLAAVEGDDRGRWLFDRRHEDARSEWPLAGLDNGVIVHVTLDRSFVADGVRWIVDFKTGRHEGGAVEAFLAREVDRYRGQLERYARVVRSLDARPIRLALYYPLVDGGWREWAFESAGTQGRLF